MARVSSQQSSFQHLYDASVQRWTSPSDDNFTSHVCGFCVMSLGLWSSSRSWHQATYQSFQAGTSGATHNYAEVGPSSCAFIIIETAVRTRVWYSRGILWWRHSLKMADHQKCVPASIGFDETALISARIECLGRQVCFLERSHPATTCGISFAGTWFPCKESNVTGSGVDHRTGIAHLNPSEAERMLCPVRQLKLYIRDSERIWGGRQRMFVHWNLNIRDIMRCHISRWIVENVKEAYTQADRYYDRVTAHKVRALSASWAYNCQVALPDILSTAFWRSSGVFQNSYLGDMAYIADGMSTLGPVVVAQQVVDPGHLHPPT